MSYVVLARKWRPQSFEDLVGQDHVSQTLGNAIAAGRVAHAFLFTGVRGVGKTTSARILAKALNCEKGPTAKPCQVCPQCVEITQGSDVDVQEIDGASYNGVDEVRRLQESLPYRPQRDRFKIFVVDEVHMLSNAAWNAFLKTLEEPPPHVKFIFATTEVHKVPVTILSRCQRYDFKLIGAQTIAARLRYVLDQEQVAADDSAVQAVAREAAGSMRDAMSLLDQVIAWIGQGGEKLTGEGVARVLGVADRSVLHRLAEAVITGDAAAAIATIGQLAEQGYDLPHVARDFLAHLRDLVVAKVSPNPATILDLADEEVRDVQAVAAKADADDLARIHLGFSKAFDDIVKSGQPRASLEMTLVRLARRPPLVPIDELLRRLAELEKRISGGSSPQGPGQGPGPRGDRGPDRSAPPAARAGEHAAPPPQTRPVASPPSNVAPNVAPPSNVASHAAPELVPSPAVTTPVAPSPNAPTVPAPVAPSEMASTVIAPTAAAEPARRPEPPSASGPPSQRPAPSSFAAPASFAPPSQRPASTGFAPPSSFTPPNPPSFVAPPPRPTQPVPAPPTRPNDAGPASAPISFGPPPVRAPETRPSPASNAPKKDDVLLRARSTTLDLAGFRAVLDLVRKTRPALASVLEHASLLRFDDKRVELGYELGSFLVGQATDAASKTLLATALRTHFGKDVELAFESISSRGDSISLAEVETAERKLKLEAARKAVENHPLVTTAIRLLGAELRDVRLAEELAAS